NSLGNFVFASHERVSGVKLFEELNQRKILVRHFSKPERINNFIRITIGKLDDMKALIENIREILNA
ncbi:MAG: histidinol-phosphate transaminase, partial [Synergistaceae bacterium]|nr:histidinol-phosphate transaminase [Synergistaceae bacterium]